MGSFSYLGRMQLKGGQVYLQWLSYLQQGHREEGGRPGENSSFLQAGQPVPSFCETSVQPEAVLVKVLLSRWL